MLGDPNSIYNDFYLLIHEFLEKVGNGLFSADNMQDFLHIRTAIADITGGPQLKQRTLNRQRERALIFHQLPAAKVDGW